MSWLLDLIKFALQSLGLIEKVEKAVENRAQQKHRKNEANAPKTEQEWTDAAERGEL